MEEEHPFTSSIAEFNVGCCQERPKPTAVLTRKGWENSIVGGKRQEGGERGCRAQVKTRWWNNEREKIISKMDCEGFGIAEFAWERIAQCLKI